MTMNRNSPTNDKRRFTGVPRPSRSQRHILAIAARAQTEFRYNSIASLDSLTWIDRLDPGGGGPAFRRLSSTHEGDGSNPLYWSLRGNLSVTNQYTPNLAPIAMFLNRFSVKHARGRLGHHQASNAIICAVSKHLLGYLSRSTSFSIVSPDWFHLPGRLARWQQQRFYPPQRASEEVPRAMTPPIFATVAPS